MDLVELSLTANVTVGKLTASDGLDRGGESEPRNSAAAKEAHVFCEGSGCGPCREECSSLSGSKKVDEDSCVHENLLSHLHCGEDSKRHDMKEADRHIPLSPNHEGKLLGRKYAKKSVGIPPKLPRVHESENYMKNIRTDVHESISNKAGFDPIRCTLADKPQLTKQKRVHDGKKTDRKHFRASLKNKYESLTSKTGLISSDTLFSGNNILGTHGLKSDLLDIAKNLDDLPLFELLDGSYKYPKLAPDKGKKYSNVNDNILLSVRKACSILCPPPHGAAENAGHVKALQNSQDPSFSAGSSPDCETKEKNLEESLIKVKADDSVQANWIEPTMFQPKNILDQLTLPEAHELESFLFNQSITSISGQCTDKSSVSISLPPFPWSFSHGGNSKPGVEFCKVNPIKNLYQGKWVRIGCSSTSTEDDKSFLSGSIFKVCGQDVDSINQQKINDVLQDTKSFTSTLQPPSDALSSKSSAVGIHSDVPVPETMSSSHGSGIPGSFNSKTSLLHEITQSFRSHPLEFDSKDHASQGTTASEVVSACQGNEMNRDPSKFSIKFKDKAILTECTTGFDDCSVSCCCYNCRTMNAGSDCSSWQLSTCEKYRKAYSSEVLSAAEILCEMACSDLKKAPKNSSGRIRWPKAPSLKTMKARKCSLTLDKPDSSFTAAGRNDLITKASKSSPSLDKPDRPCMAAGRNGSVTQTNIPSAKHRPTSERKTDIIRYINGQEAARWSSVPTGAASSPNKLEKDHNQKSPHGNNSFRPLSTQISSRADKAYENQIRKAPAKPSSVTVEGSSIRDWIRGRNKRM